MANAFERVKDEPTQKESVDFGPAPELKRRQLIFDSLRKIADHVDPGSRKTIDSSGGTYVYTWGAGYHGQLGRKFMRGQKKYASVPQYVAFPENVAIRQVACGGLHTAAVSDEGQVFTWGDGRMGQLGQVHEGFVNQPTPRAVRALTAFVMAVACGQSHTIVLTDKGKLWSWGFSRYGQTGHGDRQMVKIPKLIDTERSVEFVQIACGDKHSVALSRNGKVYSFGCGEHGQLGHGDQSDQLRPIIIQTLSTARIVSVRCGAIFTCMITESGELYVCGFGEYFYQNIDHNFMYLPRKFSFSTRISQVSCGQSHIVALSARGEVYTVGAGEYGQLGHGVRGNLSVPRLIIASKDIVQVAAGRYHSLALTNFGAIYSWGNNDNGQLGQDTDDNLLFPRVVEHILGSVVGMIQCGEHHSVALTSVKWTSLGHDVHEWFLGQKQEQILKLRYLKKTNYGLGKKELGKIKEEMLQWTKSRQKTREQTKEEEVRDTRAQLESIQTRQSMTAEISEQVESVHNLRRIRESPALRPAQEGPPELDSSLQGANSAPGKHIITVSEQQQRSRQKRSKILSKQLVALLSSRNEARQIADGASLPLIPHTDRPSANSSPQAADSPLVPALPSARTLFLRESAQMVTRMTSALTERHESDSDAHIRNTFAIVCALRKEYDAQRSKVVEKQSLLHRLQREVQYITTSTRAMETAQAQYEERLKGLEMQLDTVTIKINETEENRKNYELNIAHLKEEELDRFFQMEALRKQRAEINALYRKMNTLKNQAQIEQEQAAHEFEQFQSEIISFHQFAVDQLQSFQNVLTVLKAQRKKRQLQKADRENKTIDKFNSKIERMLGKIRAKENQANDLHKVLDGLNAQITEQKETLQRIAAATGFEKPDDIINKFYLKEEIKLDLEKEIQEKTKLLEATQQKKNDLLQRLEEEKSNFTNSRWRDVDQLQEKFRETCARADKTKIQADKATQRMALLQEGISGLLHVVAKVIGSDFDESWLESGTTWTAEKFNQVLGAFETSILTLKQSVDEATKDQDESALTRQGIKGIPYVPAYGDVDETVTELGENALSGKGLDSSAEAALEGASGSLGSGSKKKAKSAPKSPKLMARSFPGNKPFIKS